MKVNIAWIIFVSSLLLARVAVIETVGQFSETFGIPGGIEDREVPVFQLDFENGDKMLGRIQKDLERKYHSLLTNSLRSKVNKSNSVSVKNAIVSATAAKETPKLAESISNEINRQLIVETKQDQPSSKIDEPILVSQQQDQVPILKQQEINSTLKKDEDIFSNNEPNKNPSIAMTLSTQENQLKSQPQKSTIQTSKNASEAIRQNLKQSSANLTKYIDEKLQPLPISKNAMMPRRNKSSLFDEPKSNLVVKRQLIQPKSTIKSVQVQRPLSQSFHSIKPIPQLQNKIQHVESVRKTQPLTSFNKSLPMRQFNGRRQQFLNRYRKSIDSGLRQSHLIPIRMAAKKISLRNKSGQDEQSAKNSKTPKQTGSDDSLKNEGVEMITLEKIPGQPIDTTKTRKDDDDESDSKDKKHPVVNVINVQIEGTGDNASEKKANEDSKKIVNALVNEETLSNESEINVKKTDNSYNVVVDENPKAKSEESIQKPVATSNLGMSITNLEEQEKKEKQKSEEAKNVNNDNQSSNEKKGKKNCDDSSKFEGRLSTVVGTLLAIVSVIIL